MKNHILNFYEMDTALAEASYLINCMPLQTSPTLGDDNVICPNDIMGRSDEAPALDYILDTAFTKRINHIKKTGPEFLGKWCSSYYQSPINYNKWRWIDSVKVNSDGLIRKVSVKYKLPQNVDNFNLMHYAQRNVQGLAF